jgi:hypothetical protein
MCPPQVKGRVIGGSTLATLMLISVLFIEMLKISNKIK